MADLKTTQNSRSVKHFLDGVVDEQKRKDCFTLLAMMKQITKKQPRMWGPSIVGFGKYQYKYASGHEGDCFLTGFSPRKESLTIYIMAGFERFKPLMKKLGKCKSSKSCLYIKRVEDVHHDVLKELIGQSAKYISKKYN